ncbi:MAG: hypothetical protein LBL38_03315 [Lactobacillales bacterium]|jgi:hypothetical protein|nr:hypothetical protein [Lactobacillales bacterium]
MKINNNLVKLNLALEKSFNLSEILINIQAVFAAYKKIQRNKQELQKQIISNLQPNFRQLKKDICNYQFETHSRIMQIEKIVQKIQIKLKK